MLPLIAAIPGIISAVSKVTELFNSGKKAVEKVAGTPSVASTPEELRQEIQTLPPEQQAEWSKIMQQQVDLFAAQNERLATEIGLVDANITAKVTTEAASKIAVLRQTTRPWTVRMMVHFVFFPFYLVIVDLSQELVNVWFLKGLFRGAGVPVVRTFDYVFGALNPVTLASAQSGAIEKILAFLTSGDKKLHTLAGDIYLDSVPWVVSIIISYMGLREIGKITGKSGDQEQGAQGAKSGGGVGGAVSTTIQKGVDLAAKVRSIFGKGK